MTGCPRLTAEERRIYDAQGYALVPDVIPPDELEAVDREIDRLLDVVMRSPVCKRVAEDARVMDLLEDIVKPGIAIYSVNLIAKPPFSAVPCHWQQDAIPVPVKAGSAVLFSTLLWHGSKGNETGSLRRAFITSYQEATVPQGGAR